MSYSSYYNGNNCCVKTQCPAPCPTGPTGKMVLEAVVVVEVKDKMLMLD